MLQSCGNTRHTAWIISLIRDFLFAGAETDSVYSGMSDAHWRGNELKNKYLLRDSTFKCNTLFDTGSDFINFPYTLDSTKLNQVMSQGTHIMHMDCHGGTYVWSLTRLNSPNVYRADHATELYQNSPSVVFTSSCYVNDFSYSNFLGEGFMKWGANTIGFLGCSNISIGTVATNITGDKSIECSTKIIDRYIEFEKNHLSYVSLGDGYIKMKEECLRNLSNSNHDGYLWMFFSYNMLGDPNAKLYTRKPIDTGKPRTYATKDHFFIEKDTVHFFSLLKNIDNNYYVFRPTASYNGLIRFDHIIKDYLIGYFDEWSFLKIIDPLYDTNLYIYSADINDSETHNYRNIYIGEDENNSLTGNVTIRSGASQKFDYSGELNISGSFTCEQGAEIIIQPVNN